MVETHWLFLNILKVGSLQEVARVSSYDRSERETHDCCLRCDRISLSNFLLLFGINLGEGYFLRQR